MPLQKGGGALADIDRDIVDCTSDTFNDFDFGMGGVLKVHAAQGALLNVLGMVDLDDRFRMANLAEFALCEDFGEKTAVIGDGLGLEKVKPRDRGIDNVHSVRSCIEIQGGFYWN
jgi:hypothetical protein